jgi:mannose-6-phosphate isomerase-like protein (cupin superfamily)
MIKNKQNTEHYFWGNKCEGFHLVKTDNLSVIQEIMPPNTSEKLHYHNNSQQFFYILKGTATFEIEQEIFTVKKGNGIYIKSKIKHKIQNLQSKSLEFLVISQPTTRGDRIEIN